jgi:hypothetical protein
MGGKRLKQRTRKPQTMPQIFAPRANTLFRAFLVAAPFLIFGGGMCVYQLTYSDYATKVGVPIDQPVPFSHKHHVNGLGIDCRYCHDSVEKSAFAGMPSTRTCMTCHSQVWTEAPVLEPIRNSLTTEMPVRWTRVHSLPDFVYFDHSIHVRKGVACTSCHGQVEQMPILWKQHTLQMGWCLECHRHPAGALRPPAEEFNLNWDPSKGKSELGQELAKEEGVPSTRELTDCTTCHR